MSNKKAVGLAVLSGIAIGALIGVLVAPDKGSKTRTKIKGGYDDAKNNVVDKYKSAKDKFSKVDVEGTYKDLVSNLSEKSEDVVAFLESKLANLKNEVAKFK